MNQPNILLVDNEKLSRDLLASHLKQTGFRVKTAESNLDARLLAVSGDFPLAIVSRQLGEKNTQGIISCLLSADREALVFLLDSTSGAHDLESLEKMGVYDTIIRPFRLEDVRLKMKHALDLLSLKKTARELNRRLRELQTGLDSDQALKPELGPADERGEGPALKTTRKPAENGEHPKPAPKSGPSAPKGGTRGPGSEIVAADDAIEQIRRLDGLRKDGILTEEEFDDKKKELLNKI